MTDPLRFAIGLELLDRLRSSIPRARFARLDEWHIFSMNMDIYVNESKVLVVHTDRRYAQWFSYDDPEFVEKIVSLVKEVYDGKYEKPSVGDRT